MESTSDCQVLRARWVRLPAAATKVPMAATSIAQRWKTSATDASVTEAGADRLAVMPVRTVGLCCAAYSGIAGRLLTIGALLLAMAACTGQGVEAEVPMSMNIRSPAFEHNAPIPARHTCDGEEVSPPLGWSGVPAAAKSLVLIVDDPDAPDPAAPQRTWVHWVLYNLPVDAKGLPEGVLPAQLPVGTREGRNDWSRTGYGGPCPPIGRHRYFHALHALDTVLPDLGQPTKAELLKAMEGHALAQAQLVGTYQRER